LKGLAATLIFSKQDLAAEYLGRLQLTANELRNKAHADDITALQRAFPFPPSLPFPLIHSLLPSFNDLFIAFFIRWWFRLTKLPTQQNS
jgi:hypothetical protein